MSTQRHWALGLRSALPVLFLLDPRLCSKESIDLFCQVVPDRTWGNSLKLSPGRFRLDFRNNFFMEKVAKYWKGLPREEKCSWVASIVVPILLRLVSRYLSGGTFTWSVCGGSIKHYLWITSREEAAAFVVSQRWDFGLRKIRVCFLDGAVSLALRWWWGRGTVGVLFIQILAAFGRCDLYKVMFEGKWLCSVSEQ